MEQRPRPACPKCGNILTEYSPSSAVYRCNYTRVSSSSVYRCYGCPTFLRGIPPQPITSEESLRSLEKRLKTHIIGQSEAVQAVSRVIRRAYSGVRSGARPVASFLFAGAAGAGKTELANALAIEVRGSKEFLVRIEMSDYTQKNFVLCLENALKYKPNPVLLIREIEKARPEVANALLEIVDVGKLTNAPEADFSKAIIIMTSSFERPPVLMNSTAGWDLRQSISAGLSGVFRAELLYRVDEIVLFKELRDGDFMKMVNVMVKGLVDRFKPKGIELIVTDKLKNDVAGLGNHTMYGAKHLRWAFLRLVEDQLADAVLEGRVKNGGSFTLDVDPFYESHFSRPVSRSGSPVSVSFF